MGFSNTNYMVVDQGNMISKNDFWWVDEASIGRIVKSIVMKIVMIIWKSILTNIAKSIVKRNMKSTK